MNRMKSQVHSWEKFKFKNGWQSFKKLRKSFQAQKLAAAEIWMYYLFL